MPEFEEIYSEYFNDVYKYVYSLCRNSSVAEEVTQDTFFKALKSIGSFKGECKLRVWLYPIGISVCIYSDSFSNNLGSYENSL